MISFNPLQKHHFPLLQKWLNAPHVQLFWDRGIEWTLSSVEAKYASYVEGYKQEGALRKPIHPFIVSLEEIPIGYIQYYNAFDFERAGYVLQTVWKDSSASLAALDYYIGEDEYLGKNLGAEILNAFLKEHIFAQFSACLVDPDKNNKAALKSYAKAGFLTYQDLGPSILMVAKKCPERNPLIILGSSRSQGETREAIQTVIQEHPIPIVDLNERNISYYDYEYRNKNDDFMALAEQMVKHNPLILATPIYWYSMSAIMKTFIDRWSDLLDLRKDIARRLAGKELFLITSYAVDIPKGFEDPFSQTCAYLEMEYKGCFYCYNGNDPALKQQNEKQAHAFLSRLLFN